jgi:hypothetical protein
MTATEGEAVKLNSFSYARFADGSSLIYGPDGKPLPSGRYALTDLGGNQITLSIQSREEVREPRTQAEAATARGFAGRIQQQNAPSVLRR